MGPGIIQLAIEATSHPAPAVRTVASYVFQNQCAWGVDVSEAVEPLRKLLADPVARVRHQAAYAVGNLAKHKYDMSRLITPLRSNLEHEDMYVRESNAWALWQLSRSKHDIGSAVPDLVRLLKKEANSDYSEVRKQAAGAILHHAKKSAANAIQVKQAVEGANLDSRRKEIHKFVNQLAALRLPPAEGNRSS
jgi:HEAT repeat protein